MQHKLDNWLQSTNTVTAHDHQSDTQTTTVMSSTPTTEPRDRKRGHFLVSPSSSVENTSLCNCVATSKLDEVISKLESVSETVSKLDGVCSNIMQRVNDIQHNLDKLTQQVDRVETVSNENRIQINANKAEINTIKDSLEYAHKSIETISAVQNNPQPDSSPIINLLRQQSKVTQHEIDKVVAYSQRHNVLFDGIPENRNENCFRTICETIDAYLQLPNAHEVIDKAHRLGPRLTNKPRPIIVRFKFHSARDITLERRHMLKGTGMGIREHLPPRIERRQSVLDKVCRIAQETDTNAKSIGGQRLLYRGKTYEFENLKDTQLKIEHIHQKETPNAIYFQGQLSPFSNFYQSNLEIEGTTYHCVEQYYQAKKAERHGNNELFERIMLESDPAEIKKLSKSITPKLSSTPEAEQEANLKVMHQGLQAKFKHNPQLKAKLLATKNKILAEASAYDLFYGTGTALYDRKCTSETKFKGQNRLGMLLQEIRQSLK